MRIWVLIGVTLFTAKIVLAADVAPEGAMAPSKGTIGLVCVDSVGTSHFWNAQQNTDFTTCVDQVVRNWNTTAIKTDAGTHNFDELIQGMVVYHQSLDRLAAPNVVSANNASEASCERK